MFASNLSGICDNYNFVHARSINKCCLLTIEIVGVPTNLYDYRGGAKILHCYIFTGQLTPLNNSEIGIKTTAETRKWTRIRLFICRCLKYYLLVHKQTVHDACENDYLF